MTSSLNFVRKKTGWCPNTAMIHASAALPSEQRVNVRHTQPDGGDKKSRISRGAGIASLSIRTLIHNKKLLWFTMLTGLVALFMIVTETALIIYSGSFSYWISGLQPGALLMIFAVEMVSIFCLNLILAGILLSFPEKNSMESGGIQKGFSSAKDHLHSVALWSFLMAVAGTAIYMIFTHQPYFQHFYPAFGSLIINIPFVYYIPTTVLSAINFVFIKMSINILLIALTPFVIPALVLEDRTLPGALARSLELIKRVWAEYLVCILIFGLILAGVSLFLPLINMSPAIAGFDYHFFSAYGNEVAAICVSFLSGWWIAGTVVFTVSGIAILGLYLFARDELDEFKDTRIPGHSNENFTFDA